MERLGATENCSHTFNSRSDNVIVRVSFSQRPATCLAMRAQHTTLGVAWVEVFLDELGPKHASSSKLSNLHIEIHSHSEEEGDTRSDLIN